MTIALMGNDEYRKLLLILAQIRRTANRQPPMEPQLKRAVDKRGELRFRYRTHFGAFDFAIFKQH